MEGWRDFGVAEAGASAALAGLIFVAMSINLERLLAIPAIVLRAAAALTLLMGVLSIGSVMLVPDQSARAFGIESLGIGAIVWAIVSVLGVRSVRLVTRQFRQYRTNHVISVIVREITTVPTLIGGALLWQGHASGMHWLVFAFISSFAVAMTEAWVILVEIAR